MDWRRNLLARPKHQFGSLELTAYVACAEAALLEISFVARRGRTSAYVANVSTAKLILVPPSHLLCHCFCLLGHSMLSPGRSDVRPLFFADGYRLLAHAPPAKNDQTPPSLHSYSKSSRVRRTRFERKILGISLIGCEFLPPAHALFSPLYVARGSRRSSGTGGGV